MQCLENENCEQGGEAKRAVHSGQGGSSAFLVVTALGSTDLSVHFGVHELALADERAADKLLLLHRLVVVAGIRNVVGGLEVESAGNIVKLGSLNPTVC
jgi:hypothetical protein